MHVNRGRGSFRRHYVVRDRGLSGTEQLAALYSTLPCPELAARLTLILLHRDDELNIGHANITRFGFQLQNTNLQHTAETEAYNKLTANVSWDQCFC